MLELDSGVWRCPVCRQIYVHGISTPECPHDARADMQWFVEILRDIHKEKQPLSLVEQQVADILRDF